MIKAAVIGVGSMGANHVRVLSNLTNVTLCGVVDANELHGLRVAERFKTNYYSSVESLLMEQSPDFVCIAVPTALHRKVAQLFLEKSTHVLVEKPIAASSEDAVFLNELAKKHKVKLLPGHIERYNPAIRMLKKQISESELGPIYRIEVTRAGPFPSRIQDVGVARDLAVHDLDVISYLLGEKPEALFCEKQRLLHSTGEDALAAIIRYPHNITCLLNVNWTSPTKTRTLKVFGHRGMFHVDYIDQEIRFFENADQISKDVLWEQATISEGREIKYPIRKSEPLANEIEYFISAIDKCKNLDEEIESGINAIRIVEKMDESARLNQFVYFK